MSEPPKPSFGFVKDGQLDDGQHRDVPAPTREEFEKRLEALRAAAPPFVPVELFEYSGLVYVRPTYRGICLLDPPVGGADMQAQLDDMVDHGYYRVEIRFVRVPDPDDPADLV